MLIKLLLLASQCLMALRQAPRLCAKLALVGVLVLAVGGCAGSTATVAEKCEGDFTAGYGLVFDGSGTSILYYNKNFDVVQAHALSRPGPLDEEAFFDIAFLVLRDDDFIPSSCDLSKVKEEGYSMELVSETEEEQQWLLSGLCSAEVSETVAKQKFMVRAMKGTYFCKPAVMIDKDGLKRHVAE